MAFKKTAPEPRPDQNKLVKVVNENGDAFHTVNGRLHHHNGPAVVYKNGTKQYYREGRLHNLVGPAVVNNVVSPSGKNTTKMLWFVAGQKAPKGYDDWIMGSGMFDTEVTEEDKMLIQLIWGDKLPLDAFAPTIVYEEYKED